MLDEFELRLHRLAKLNHIKYVLPEEETQYNS